MKDKAIKFCILVALFSLINSVYAEENDAVFVKLQNEDEYMYIKRLQWSLPRLLENADRKNEIIMEFILQELKNNENEIMEKLPFLECSVSDDSQMKIYKWNGTQSGDDIYYTVVKYNDIVISLSGLVSDLPAFSPKTFSFIPDHSWKYLAYEFIDIISNGEKRIYILNGKINAGDGFKFAGFIGVEVVNDRIELVDIFKGKKQMGFNIDILIGRKIDDKYLASAVTIIKSNKVSYIEPFRIEILLARCKDDNEFEYKTLFFIYNRGIIEGNYNELNTDNMWE
ncbi:hypothetical protein FACS1894147_06570 [Spirochaetia bacterium]|nr:hypothetical protein FACS1894147_06570 [Spirochaetia bacterium]